jgi:L-threonylcarbamoyladenylate synthase
LKTHLTNSVQKASSFIRKGEIAAFPTETVYGLGANTYDENAVKKIFKAKGRPADNPLIVHIASKKDIELLAREIPAVAKKIINKFFPGPITVILEKNEIISDLVTSGLDTIAIRMPSSKLASQFINACGVPIAAPSANLSGSPSPTSFIHVLEDFKGKIPCLLIGPKAKYGVESTVVDCTGRVPRILRPGVVTLEQLRKIDKRFKVLKKPALIKSPGQKYRHYSPKAKVKLISDFGFRVSDFKKTAYIGIKVRSVDFGHCKICDDLNDYAKNLFSFFRECDAKKIKIIYCQRVPEKGIGLAIMNRLKKAVSS